MDVMSIDTDNIKNYQTAFHNATWLWDVPSDPDAYIYEVGTVHDGMWAGLLSAAVHVKTKHTDRVLIFNDAADAEDFFDNLSLAVGID